MNICHHMLTMSTQLQNRSFHVVERTRTSSKCQKMKNARAKRAKILFFIVKYANLWGFCCRRRRGCLSSLFTISYPTRAHGIIVKYTKMLPNTVLNSATARQFRDMIFKILRVWQYRISSVLSQSVHNIGIECYLVPFATKGLAKRLQHFNATSCNIVA